MLRRAFEHRFEKIDGLLRQPIAGKKIYIGEGLSDKPLGLIFLGGFHRRELRKRLRSGLGSRWHRSCPSEARLQKTVLAPHRFIFRVAVEELLESSLRFCWFSGRFVCIGKRQERVRHAERIAGPPVELDKPFAGFDGGRKLFGGAIEGL